MAGAIAALLVLDGLGVPGAFAAARIAVRLLLAAYPFAGVLNAPFFPSSVRGPTTGKVASDLLLNMWTVIALIVGAAAAIDGSICGLL